MIKKKTLSIRELSLGFVFKSTDVDKEEKGKWKKEEQ